MRSLISRGMERAGRLHDAYRADAGMAVRAGGGGGPGPVMTGGSSGVGVGRHVSSAGSAADQYSYFSGYPYSIINVIANRLAAQPIRVARRLPDGVRPAPGRSVLKAADGTPLLPKAYHDQTDRLEVVPNHRINRVLDNPNELMVRHHLMYITFASMEITGRAYWWMFKGPDGDELWPLPTHWVEPVPGEDKLFDYYRVSMPVTGQIVRVPARQIVPFFFPDPSDPFGAYSPMQALARTVLTDHAYETAQRVSFENGINPGLAIIVGRPPEFAGTNQEQIVLTKEQRGQLVAAVKRQWRGVQKFDEPLILDALIKDVKQISTTPKEMAFKDSGPLVRDRLAQGWGMNPITLGEIEGANYASSGVADHHVARTVFAPRTEMNSQTLTCYLPKYFGRGQDRDRVEEAGDLVVYQEPVVPSDPEMENARDAADHAAAVLSRNDLRRKRGLPPLHDGDNALTAAGWVPVETEDQAKAARQQAGPGGVKYFLPLAHRVTDAVGHEHDADGKFGSGGGGSLGGGGDNKPAPKPDGGGAAKPAAEADSGGGDHDAVHASWGAEDDAMHARHTAEAKTHAARQEGEQQAHDRRQGAEVKHLERAHGKEEAALVKGFEAADAAVGKAREKEDAGVEKAREKEDKANEKKWEKEDAGVEKAREKEDKETAKARAAAGKEMDDRHDAEMTALQGSHKSEMAEATAKHDADAAALEKSHPAERGVMEDRHEAELADKEPGTQEYNEIAARQLQEDLDLDERHAAEAEAVAAALQDVKDRHEEERTGLEAKHEAASEELKSGWDTEDEEREADRAASDEKRRDEREAAVQEPRDAEDEEREAARAAEDEEREAGEQEARDALEEKQTAEQDALEERHSAETDEIGERHAAEDEELDAKHEAEKEATDERRSRTNPDAHAEYEKGYRVIRRRGAVSSVKRRVKVTDSSGHEHDQSGRFGSGGGGSSGGSSGGGKVTHDSPADPAKVGHGGGSGSVTESDDSHAKRAAGFMSGLKKLGAGAVSLGKKVAAAAVQKVVLANAHWAAHGADIVDAAVDNASDWGMITNSHMVKEQLGMSGQVAAKAGSLIVGYAVSKIRQAIAGRRAEAGKGHGGAWLKDDGDDGDKKAVSIKDMAQMTHDLLSAMLEAGGTPEDEIPTVEQIADRMAEKHEAGGDDSADGDADKTFGGVAARVKAAADAVDPVQWTAAQALKAELAPAFHKLGQEAARHLREALAAGGRPSPAELAHAVVRRSHWEAELAPAVFAGLEAAVRRGAVAEWELFKASGAARHLHGRAAEFLAEKAFPAKFLRLIRRVVEDVIDHGVIRAVVDNTLKLVEAVIGKGVGKGLTGPDLADFVAGRALTGAAAERAADGVARTEGGAAVSGGQGAVRDEVARHGGVAGVRWVTRHDERVRPTHRRANGQTVRPGQPFVVGGHKCDRPGDPTLPAEERSRCRCQAVTVYRSN